MEEVLTNIGSWLSDNQSTILTIVLVILGARLVVRFGSIAIRKAVIKGVRASSHSTKTEEKKREETVIQIISGALNILVWPIALIIVVGQLGVDIGPLIAGAGIIGVALGFGAQSLVKDMISGLFIIAENQYAVGDVVSLDDTSGRVERITLRSTVLRDLDGIVHHVPNGTIDRASNFSSEKSGINLDIGVSYDSDLDHVIKVINKVCHAMAEDPRWEKDIVEEPAFLRVDSFDDSSIGVKITGTVKPLKQWDVTGELRKRIKIAFDKEGIEIPFPQRVIHQAK